jgi:hypothetical protein
VKTERAFFLFQSDRLHTLLGYGGFLMNTVKLTCETCGKSFSRRAAEVKRNKKKSRKTYCSLACVGKDHHRHLEEYDNSENLVANNRRDEFTPFRYIMKCINNKHKGRGSKRKPCYITLTDLKEQWEKQVGICPYTGWKLKLRESTSNEARLECTPDRASLDRIDSSKPYTKDNIQFVSMIAQFAKNRWTGEELRNFCKAVVEHSC